MVKFVPIFFNFTLTCLHLRRVVQAAKFHKEAGELFEGDLNYAKAIEHYQVSNVYAASIRKSVTRRSGRIGDRDSQSREASERARGHGLTGRCRLDLAMETACCHAPMHLPTHTHPPTR